MTGHSLITKVMGINTTTLQYSTTILMHHFTCLGSHCALELLVLCSHTAVSATTHVNKNVNSNL